MKRQLAALVVILLASLSGHVFAQDSESLDGVWATNGYGLVFEVANSTITVYETTAISCLNTYSGPLDGDFAPDLQKTLVREGDQVVIQNNLTAYMTANRLPELPDVCANGGTAQSDDPELTFDVFWNTLNENYAFFDLYGVDWQAQYDTYRPQVTAETTPDELFAILSQMLEPIQDGHTWVNNGVDQFSGETLPAWFVGQETRLGVYLRGNFAGADTTLIGDYLMVYRRLSDSVGYVAITQMSGYGEDEWAAAGEAMDEVLAALDGVQTMIIDVRFNGGGYDGVALAIASRFADQERLAFSKKTRDGDGWTPVRDYFFAPEGPRQFTGQVIVLESGLTASAAEMFVMAMQALPNVTVIGELTAGSHSDMLVRGLPNGWYFSLSNQVYYASDGQVYENVGLPADIEIPMNTEHLYAGQDDMLNAALELAAE